MSDWITALHDLSAAAAIDETPEPNTATWTKGVGLSVTVKPGDVETWLKATLKTTGPSVESFAWGDMNVHCLVECVIAATETPCRLVWFLAITQDQLAVQRASQLSFEEVVRWFDDWPGLSVTDQIREHKEMVEVMGVPESLLPERPEVGDEYEGHTHATWVPTR